MTKYSEGMDDRGAAPQRFWPLSPRRRGIVGVIVKVEDVVVAVAFVPFLVYTVRST